MLIYARGRENQIHIYNLFYSIHYYSSATRVATSPIQCPATDAVPLSADGAVHAMQTTPSTLGGCTAPRGVEWADGHAASQ